MAAKQDARNKEIFKRWKAGGGDLAYPAMMAEYGLSRCRLRDIVQIERLAEYHRTKRP